LYFKKVNDRVGEMPAWLAEARGRRGAIRIGPQGRTRGAKLAMTGEMGENA
jgi:hypothetical protein